MMDINSCNANNPNNFNNNNVQTLPYVVRAVDETSKGSDLTETPIADLAQEYTSKNNTAITVSLKDFTYNLKSLHGRDCSTVTPDDLKGLEHGNMFRSDAGKAIVQDAAYIDQASIFQQNIAHDGGLRYAGKDDDLAKAALNYAQADIAAIEKAYDIVYDKGKINGKLDSDEIKSSLRSQYNSFGSLMGRYNLDSDPTLGAKEIASIILALDTDGDGLLTQEEAKNGTEMSYLLLREYAKQEYNENYAGLFGKIK